MKRKARDKETDGWSFDVNGVCADSAAHQKDMPDTRTCEIPGNTRHQDVRDTGKAQDGPKKAQDVPQECAKAPRWPKDGPKTTPIWPHDGPKRAPRGLQEGFKMEDNSKTLQDTSTYAKTFILPGVLTLLRTR